MQFIYWLIAILLSAAAGYWVYLSDKKRAVPYPIIPSLLRGLVIFFTILLVLVPAITITKNIEEKPIVVFLQDNSQSISGALNADSVTYKKNAELLLDRLSEKYKVVKWGFGSSIQTDSIFFFHQTTTDISVAISRAQEFFGMQNLGAVILASDGRFNRGVNPIFLQTSLNCQLYTVGIGDSTQQKDISVAKTYNNKYVTLNSNFEIRADIVASLCKGYNNSLQLREEGNLLSSIPIVINGMKYDNTFSFTVKAEKPGIHHYTLSLPIADDEKNVLNNKRDIFVDVVEEKKNILIASSSPHPDVNAIKEALTGLETYKVTVCNADNFPNSLNKYSIIILHGLPSLRNNITSTLIGAKKPLWIILNNQSNYQIINDIHNLTHTTISPAPVHNIFSTYNPSFNAFTIPQQINLVTDKMPPLSANVSNIIAGPGTMALFDQKTGVGENKTPVWVLQQGEVPCAFLLGEGIWRWRLYEYKNFNNHNIIDECIRQTIAFLCTNNTEKQFSVALPKNVWSDQEAISLNAFLLNANREQINTADVKIVITDSSGRKQDYSFERAGTSYRLNIGIHAGGIYKYSASTTYNGNSYATNGNFVVESTPLELMETGADYSLLYSLAKKFNGGFVPANKISTLYDSITHNEHVKPVIRTNIETVPLIDRKWYFFIILIFAVAEWLLRKYWLAQ